MQPTNHAGGRRAPLSFPDSSGAASVGGVWVAFTLLSLGMTLFLSVSAIAKNKRGANLQAQKVLVQKRYDHAKAEQKTGMLAASILNELEGWARIAPVPVQQLECLSNLPMELELNCFSVDRPFLYRSLPEHLQDPFFKYALVLAGSTTVELVDSGDGKGKHVFPAFLDRINSKFHPPFVVEVPEEDELEARSFNRWRLTASMNKELAWRSDSQEGSTP